MVRKKFTLHIITLVIILTTILTGCKSDRIMNSQENIDINNNEVSSKLNKYMDNYYKKNEFSGTILITQNDEVLLNKGYGTADFNKNINNKPGTIFEIASLTKQFTATGILMLRDNNLLNIQDTLDKYIPDYPNGDQIRLYNLLTHTSGIPEYLDYVDPTEPDDKTYTPEELIELFKNEPLNFNPGTSFEYTNSNYILLGYIIEKVSNMKYEDYIQTNILTPLNLNSTGFVSTGNNIKNKSTGYYFINRRSHEHAPAPETESMMSYSAGEIYSTSEDLLKWENALFSEKIISKDSLNEMLTVNLNNYGYGWFIDEGVDGDKFAFHSGNLPGYTSFIERNIDKNYTIIILSNENIDEAINTIQTRLSEILDSQ